MITSECTQGINIITLCKYDEYNDVGTTKDAIKGTDINMEINSLKEEWAQLRAQLAAQPMNNNPPQFEFSQKLGHTEGTNTKKDKEREYIDMSLNNQKKENTPDGVSKKAKLSSPSPSEKIDYSGLMEYYNTTFKGRLQQIRSMTDVRKRL